MIFDAGSPEHTDGAWLCPRHNLSSLRILRLPRPTVPQPCVRPALAEYRLGQGQFFRHPHIFRGRTWRGSISGFG